MLTLVEIIACRDKLRDADMLMSKVRGAFIIAQFTHGARITNDVLGLIGDLLRDLDSMETMLNAGGQP
jgi:hypothetical protein